MTAGLSVGLLGFGEVGQVLADDLSPVDGISLRAYDILFGGDSGAQRALEVRPQVEAAASGAELAAASEVVISAVTAAEDLEATRSMVAGLAAGTYILDLNSVAPDTRRACAAILDGAGGRYVEGAVMAPIAARRIRSPILLGGPQVESFLPMAARLGFGGARAFSADIGRASATKMCRSVIVKGLEAVVTESLVAARHYGVEREVLDSLADLAAGRDWPAYAQYLIGRSIEHGLRRAEEMREVAATVRAAGIEPLMSNACAARQAWAARFRAALEQPALQPMLDSIREDLTPMAGT